MREALSAVFGTIAVKYPNSDLLTFALLLLSTLSFLEAFWKRKDIWGLPLTEYRKIRVTLAVFAVFGYGCWKVGWPDPPYFVPEVTPLEQGKKRIYAVDFKVYPGGYSSHLIGQFDDVSSMASIRTVAKRANRSATSLEQYQAALWYNAVNINSGEPANRPFLIPTGARQRTYYFGQHNGPFGEYISIRQTNDGQWTCLWHVRKRTTNRIVAQGECPPNS